MNQSQVLKARCLALSLVAMMISNVYTERVSYGGFTVIRVNPETEDQVNQLRSLQSEAEQFGQLDFWTYPNAVNSSVDIMSGPEEAENLQYWLEQHSMPKEIMISDLDRKIKQTMPSPIRTRFFEDPSYKAAVLSAKNYFSQYQRYSTIQDKILSLRDLDSRIIVKEIGRSFEKRPLYLIKVSNDHKANKPIVFIDAGHHAREWISHATLIYLLESIVNIDTPKLTMNDCSIESCRQVVTKKTKLDLENFDYYFVPVVNPDGYEYSHTSDRLWRKTRSRSSGGFFGAGLQCAGTDPNRNYNYHWGESGTSSYPCSEIYGGKAPFSEPETMAVSSVLWENKDRIAMYVSLHAYSQLLLTPYGYARIYPENYENLAKVTKAGAEELRKLRNTDYGYGPSSIVLYPSAGGSDDYAHGRLGVKYSLCMELPDKGKSGFVLPPSEIIPVGHETLLSLRAMTDTILELEPQLLNKSDPHGGQLLLA